MAYATFVDLPAEMVGNVLAFIRPKPDQSSVCLVSRACRDLMAPMMWELFEADFRNASVQSLATLLHPQSGITSRVRELDVLGSTLSVEGADRVMLFIAAIPRDRLRRFESTYKISALMFQVLLQSQRKIEDINAWCPFTCPGQLDLVELESEDHHTWMGPLLPEVSKIVLNINPHETQGERIFHSLKSVSQCCPRITDLALNTESLDTRTDVSVCAILSQTKDYQLFPNLTTLRLYNVRVATTADRAIDGNLHLSNLKVLQLEGCIDQISFLKGLSSFYTSNVGQLEELILILPIELTESENTVQAIELLLKTCPKLSDLQLDLSVHRLVAKDSVMAHHKTLESLMLGTGDFESGRYYSAADIKSILNGCTKVEQLAIDMPPLNLGSISKPVIRFSSNEEYGNVLAAVSALPVLQGFRILNRPAFEVEEPLAELSADQVALFCRVAMQDFANHILRFVVDRGSNLQVLSIKPSLEPDPAVYDTVARDSNGHQWPEYNYIRGHTSDVTGTTAVVAHPSKNVVLDFPDLAGFMQYI